MNPFQLNTSGQENSLNRDIDIIMAVLESGNSVELNATGYSMFPTLRPGDKVIVKPFPEGEIPKPGSVVVYRDNNSLVIHRMVEIQNNNGEYIFITRGDSRMGNDLPLGRQKLIGQAVTYKRGEKVQQVKNIVPGRINYKFNWFALWFYFKIKKY